jgi:hypothetical protein
MEDTAPAHHLFIWPPLPIVAVIADTIKMKFIGVVIFSLSNVVGTMEENSFFSLLHYSINCMSSFLN